MAEDLFVRIPNTAEADQLQWLLLDELSGVMRSHGSGSDDALGQFIEDSGWIGQTIVLVPTEQILLTTANIPSKKPRQILQALPFVIEEQLAVKVESMHLAMGSRNEQGEIRVAAAARATVSGWLERLDDIGLSPQMMVPDALCVPGGSNEVNILLDETRALLRVGLSEGFAIDMDQVSTFLGLLNTGKESDDSPVYRLIWDQSEAQQVLYAQWQAELDGALLQEPLDYPPFETLCREYHSKDVINLLQEEFKPVSAEASSAANWKSVAVLILVGFLLHVSSLIGQGFFLNSQAAQYKEEAQQLYKGIYPNDRNVRDLRRRWQSHINGSGNSDIRNDFLLMFSTAASELKSTRLQLDNINFNQTRGDLTLQVSAPNSDQLVAYSQKITAAGLVSEIGTISQENNTVKGSIRIRGIRGPKS